MVSGDFNLVINPDCDSIGRTQSGYEVQALRALNSCLSTVLLTPTESLIPGVALLGVEIDLHSLGAD
jgi:hypothetical protein